MVIFDGDRTFESFYLKHFNSLQDLQNCTECFKNLSIYSSSIYYQTSQFDTGSFRRILTENDTWLDSTFWKNGGNYMSSPFSLGTLNSNPISFIVSGSQKMLLTSNGIGINMSPSYSLDISGSVRVYQNSLYVTSIGSVGGIIDYTRYLSVSGSIGTDGQFLKRTVSGNGWNNILTNDVSGLDTFTSSINTFTGSVNTILSNLNASTSSLNSFSSSINTFTGSVNTSLSNLNTFSSSINTFTGSVNTSLSNLNTFSSSINTFTSSVNTTLSNLNTFSSSFSSSLNILLDDTFWKNGGNYMKTPFSLGTLNSNPISFIVSGSQKMLVTSDGIGINMSPSYSLDINGDVRVYRSSLYVTSIGSVGGIIDYTRFLSINGSTGINGQFLKRTFSSNEWNNILTSDVSDLNSYTSSINTFTGSVNTSLSSLNSFSSSINTFTGSVNTSISNLNTFSSSINTFTGSVNTSISNLNTFSSSINTFTGSVNTTLSNLNTFSSSINSLTGSYFIQNGNSFGTTATLGTNDNNSLIFETSGSARMFISSSGFIGIGNTTPETLLHLKSTTALTSPFIRLESTSTGRPYIDFKSSGSLLGYIGWGANFSDIMYIRNSRDSDIYFTTNATDRMVIKNTGNVTIGATTDYGHKLSVEGTSRFNGASNYYVAANFLNEASIIFYASSGSRNVSQRRQTTGEGDINGIVHYGYDGTTYNIGLVEKDNGNVGINTHSPAYKLDVSGSMRTVNDAYFATTSGNVGIGTTTPSYKLDVNGSFKTTSTTDLAVGGTGLTSIGAIAGTNTVGVEIGTNRTGTGTSYIDLGGEATNTDFGLRMMRDGFTSQIQHSGTGNMNINSIDVGNLLFSTQNTERMRINSSGSVGIGTPSPSSLLHAIGTIQTSSTSSASSNYANRFNNIIFSRSDVPTTFTNVISNSWSGTPSDQTMNFEIGNSSSTRVTALTLLGNGNVGIGVTTPSSQLEITKSAMIGFFSDAASLTVRNYQSGLNYVNDLILIGKPLGSQINVFQNKNLSLATNNTDRLTIFGNGNIGVNTTTDAGYKLDVTGTSRFTSKVTINSTLNSGLTVLNGSSNGQIFNDGNMHIEAAEYLWINGNSTSLTQINAGGGNTFINSGGGRVGIGTITPSASAVLDITSTTQGVLFPRMTTTQINGISSPANGLTVYNTELTTLCFYHSGGWKKVSHSNM